MRRAGRWVAALLMMAVGNVAFAQRGYAGFDKDGYPGDDVLPALHKTFAFTAYWLNHPPGMETNPWAGKRAVVRAAGFGFLISFNGRLDAQLRGQDAAALGRRDEAYAVAAAQREGFPADAVIFLDQEEGGALLPEQAAYVGAWIAAVERAGLGAGVYASGVPVDSGARRFRRRRMWRSGFRRRSCGCGTIGVPRLRDAWRRTGNLGRR
jgi:hypothetical protein